MIQIYIRQKHEANQWKVTVLVYQAITVRIYGTTQLYDKHIGVTFVRFCHGLDDQSQVCHGLGTVHLAAVLQE